MSAELAHPKADKHLCVALRYKVRIRLHPSMESVCGIASNRGNLPSIVTFHKHLSFIHYDITIVSPSHLSYKYLSHRFVSILLISYNYLPATRAKNKVANQVD